jgi:hypothetical protein
MNIGARMMFGLAARGKSGAETEGSSSASQLRETVDPEYYKRVAATPYGKDWRSYLAPPSYDGDIEGEAGEAVFAGICRLGGAGLIAASAVMLNPAILGVGLLMRAGGTLPKANQISRAQNGMLEANGQPQTLLNKTGRLVKALAKAYVLPVPSPLNQLSLAEMKESAPKKSNNMAMNVYEKLWKFDAP